MLTVKTLTVGDLAANCYLVSSSDGGASTDDDSSEVETGCVIIDPGDDADFISETITNQKLKPLAIILTHGHFDHVLGCLELKLNFALSIYLNEKDRKLYTSANQSAKHWLKKNTLKVPPIDQFIKEGDEIKIGNEKLKVIETPGHTPGSICLYQKPYVIPAKAGIYTNRSPIESGMTEGALFTGDTLFKDGVGRTDFSYSRPLQLTKSLERIFKLPPETAIYPGHGDLFSLQDFIGQPQNL